MDYAIYALGAGIALFGFGVGLLMNRADVRALRKTIAAREARAARFEAANRALGREIAEHRSRQPIRGPNGKFAVKAGNGGVGK